MKRTTVMLRRSCFICLLLLSGCGRVMTPKEQHDTIAECHKYGLVAGPGETGFTNKGWAVTSINCYPPEEKKQ